MPKSAAIGTRSIGGADPRGYAAFEVRAGRQIMTDEEDAILIYAVRVEDPMRFDPLFIEALGEAVMATNAATTLRPGRVQSWPRSYGSAARAFTPAPRTQPWPSA